MRPPPRLVRARLRLALAAPALALFAAPGAASPVSAPAVAAPSQRADALVFEGRIEAVSRAAIASGRDGKVVEILFEGGETVSAGDPLIRLDDAFQTLEATIASAEARGARARAALAEADKARIEELGRRDVASGARIDAAHADAEVAAAAADRAEAAEAMARLRVERSVLRAPIAGRISRPDLEIGAFVEAKAGPPLAEIVALDPVIVAYSVPYDDRLATLREAGEPDLSAIFARITLVISAAGGALVSDPVRPEMADATVDPATGAVTVRARLPNPGELFRPGMRVSVSSTLGPAAEAVR